MLIQNQTTTEVNMFWTWFAWQVAHVEPVSTLGDIEETYRMNDITELLWRTMPSRWQGFDMILEIRDEENFKKNS
jgi:hypothetical protein